MQSRREFLGHAAALSGAAGFWSALAAPIRRALAIDPEPNSSFLDAEHVVILMQENRSFDHCFGTLQGVRGFNDPRAIELPNQNPVWVQTDAKGRSYAPFRLNLKDSQSTWMGSLPHSWQSQVDARNDGNHDRWLTAKQSDDHRYADIPFTLGYYDRNDIPFYYSLADAFTICDQYFCSCLTPTTPNRLHLWTGTIRQHPSADSQANVCNENVDYDHMATWTTFPERLEDLGIPWKIYQNELGFDSGLDDQAYAWLANFGDNPIEFFSQFQYGFARTYRERLQKLVESIPAQIESLKNAPPDSLPPRDWSTKLAQLTATLKKAELERSRWSDENFAKLPARQKSLHERAFCTNEHDPLHRQMSDLSYRDGSEQRRIHIPSGDVLFQFRKDVDSGKLPAVSWLVAPERFSDHPSSPWFGAWYIAEMMNILTSRPDIWKKAIFILTYDENDGFFDHVPPFVAPHPRRRETGFASKGLDTSVEYVELDHDRKRVPPDAPRESPIGLGYRVPTIIASPWTRGGCVCSQVSDHTSILQLLEKIFSRKTAKPLVEINISAWRRTVCGDLTCAFQKTETGAGAIPSFPPRDSFIEQIDKARLKPLPSGYQPLTKNEIQQIRHDPSKSSWMPRQEIGVRRSCPLPYELYVSGSLSKDRRQFQIILRAGRDKFAASSAGSPFTAYAMIKPGELRIRSYAVVAGDQLEDAWNLGDFAHGIYRIDVHGPNGFFRQFMGSADDPRVQIRLEYAPAYLKDHSTANPILEITNDDPRTALTLNVADHSYKSLAQEITIDPRAAASSIIDTKRSAGWYDCSITMKRTAHFEQRFTGHFETGEWSHTDPAMGMVVS